MWSMHGLIQAGSQTSNPHWEEFVLGTIRVRSDCLLAQIWSPRHTTQFHTQRWRRVHLGRGCSQPSEPAHDLYRARQQFPSSKESMVLSGTPSLLGPRGTKDNHEICVSIQEKLRVLYKEVEIRRWNAITRPCDTNFMNSYSWSLSAGDHTSGDTHRLKVWSRLCNSSFTVKSNPEQDPEFAARKKKRWPPGRGALKPWRLSLSTQSSHRSLLLEVQTIKTACEVTSSIGTWVVKCKISSLSLRSVLTICRAIFC